MSMFRRPALGDKDDPLGPERPSGSYLIPATQHDVKEAKKAVEAVVAVKNEQLTRTILSSDVKWFVASMVAAVGIAFAGFFQLEARAQQMIDGGTRSLAARIVRNESRIEHVEKAVVDLSIQSARTMVMVEMLVTARGLTLPPKADGGP